MSKTENIEQKAKKQLDESLHDLSPDIIRRLQQARYAALEKATQKNIWSAFPQVKYAMIALAIVSVSIFFNIKDNNPDLSTLAMESDIEMLTSNESLDLLEDLEFMQWLAETEKNVS
jgi:hypothetical protein